MLAARYFASKFYFYQQKCEFPIILALLQLELLASLCQLPGRLPLLLYYSIRTFVVIFFYLFEFLFLLFSFPFPPLLFLFLFLFLACFLFFHFVSMPSSIKKLH